MVVTEITHMGRGWPWVTIDLLSFRAWSTYLCNAKPVRWTCFPFQRRIWAILLPPFSPSITRAVKTCEAECHGPLLIFSSTVPTSPMRASETCPPVIESKMAGALFHAVTELAAMLVSISVSLCMPDKVTVWGLVSAFLFVNRYPGVTSSRWHANSKISCLYQSAAPKAITKHLHLAVIYLTVRGNSADIILEYSHYANIDIWDTVSIVGLEVYLFF